jgi:hypothetical protein
MSKAESDVLAQLELGQFSLKYEDLPTVEDTKTFEEGRIYRSERAPKLVFIYHAHPGQFDRFYWL